MGRIFSIICVTLLFASPVLFAGEFATIPETLEDVTDSEILAELQKEIPYYNYLSDLGSKGVYYKKAVEKATGTAPEFSAETLKVIQDAEQAQRTISVQQPQQSQVYRQSSHQTPHRQVYSPNGREYGFDEERMVRENWGHFGLSSFGLGGVF